MRRAGSALAVDVGDEDELGYWGEVLTTAAEARGLTGLVIDGGVRDTGALGGPRVPRLLHHRRLPRGVQERPGAVGLPVVVGGVPVEAGDWLVGDGDGVAVVPAAALEDVLRRRARPGRQGGQDVRVAAPGGHDPRAAGLDPSPVEGA